MPGQTNPEDEKTPEDEKEMKKQEELEKAGKLQTGLQSIKERLDSVLGKLKGGTMDDSVLVAVRGMATDLGKLADAYPSPKSEKREFTSDQFDEFVASEVQAIAAETDDAVRKERGEFLGASISEFQKAMEELEKNYEGTTPPAVTITTYKDGWKQPEPTKTTSSATMPPAQPSVANIGKGDGEAEGAGDGDGAASEGEPPSAADAAPGEGVQTEEPPSEEDPGTAGSEDWGTGWGDLTEGIDEEEPVAKAEPAPPQGSIGDLTNTEDEAPAPAAEGEGEGASESQATAQ